MQPNKRDIESDRRAVIRTRCKAACHAAKVGPALPYAYARGSTIYAAAFAGREVTAADIARMQAEQYKPLAVPQNAADT